MVAQCTMYNVLVRLLSAEGKYKYNVHCTQCTMYVYYPQKSSTSTVRELSLGDNWALLGRDPYRILQKIKYCKIYFPIVFNKL